METSRAKINRGNVQCVTAPTERSLIAVVVVEKEKLIYTGSMVLTLLEMKEFEELKLRLKAEDKVQGLPLPFLVVPMLFKW